MVAATSTWKRQRPSLEPVFGLSVLGYCRNMAAQYGSSVVEDPLPMWIWRAHSANENTTILSFRCLYTNENIVMNIIFIFLQLLFTSMFTLLSFPFTATCRSPVDQWSCVKPFSGLCIGSHACSRDFMCVLVCESKQSRAQLVKNISP